METKKKVIRHYLAPFDKDTRTQTCSMCGQVIHDYSNVLYAPSTNNLPVVERGWAEGEHYVTEGNPTYFSIIAPPKETHNVVLCTVNKK